MRLLDTLFAVIPLAHQKDASYEELSLEIHRGPKQPNKAELGAMEFFILALVAAAHLTSLYQFQQRARL